MKPKLLLILLTFVGIFQVRTQTNKPLVLGEIQTLYSHCLKEDRNLNLYLPPGYDSSKKNYPVLYLLDGSIDEDFVHIAGLTQFFSLMFNAPELIVVGIANVDRKRDFTFPSKDPEMLKIIPSSGHSDSFIAFIEKELQPFIDQHYKTNTTRYLIGQSLGGLLATEILLKKPRLFTHYLIVSPSLWWNKESLLKEAPALLATAEHKGVYVYVSAGKNEPKVMRKDAAKLHKILKKHRNQNIKTDFTLMKGENHATVLHISIYQAFLRLFPLKE